MKSINWRGLLPHLIIIALFAGLVCAYFQPLVFGGKNLKQGDAFTWSGNAQEISKYREKTGEEALWTNGSFSGMPAYTISVVYSGELFDYVERVLRLGIPYPASIIFVSLLCYYILMLALGHRPPLAALGAVAFTFFTFTFVSIEAGHNSKVRAMALAPLMLAGVVSMYRSKRWLGFALTALGIGMQIRAGHYQITYYLAIFTAFLGLGYLIMFARRGKLSSFVFSTSVLILAVALGVLTNTARLWQLKEYAQYSMRGKPELTPKGTAKNNPTDGGLNRDYVFQWSNELPESFTLLIPYFYGGSSSESTEKGSALYDPMRKAGYQTGPEMKVPTYWGDQPFTSGPVYAGAIVLFLAVLALVVLPAQYTWWLAGVALFGLALSWGKHFEGFNYAMYDYFPAYNSFRSVTMAQYMTQLALPWLAVAGLARLLGQKGYGTHPIPLAVAAAGPDAEPKAAMAAGSQAVQPAPAFGALHPDLQRKLLIGLGIVGGLALIFALSPSLAGSFTSPQEMAATDPQAKQQTDLLSGLREDLLRGDAWRTLLLVLAAGAVLFAFLRGWINGQVTSIVVAVMVLFDLWAVNKRYLGKESFEKNYYQQGFQPNAADERMMRLPYHTYRVLNLQGTFSESRTSYYHQSIGGYSPVKLRRYQDLIVGPDGGDGHLAAEIQRLPQLLQTGNVDSAFNHTPVLDMLNARFIKFGDQAEQVIENPRACGNAWFVPAVQEVSSADEEYNALAQPGFHPKAVAIMDKTRFPIPAKGFDTTGASASIAEYTPRRIVYKANNPHEGLLIFSENYYPEGWEVTVDGASTEFLRADYTLRALPLRPGQHTIECRFNPKSYTLGNLISLGASGLVLLILVFVGYKASEDEY